ncbi:MAG TPA: hypothetical protein VFP37_10765 [Steroidobacteraceae bacterium]|nr:hypothetical protein [Steroidobacteraceae bacterium]
MSWAATTPAAPPANAPGSEVSGHVPEQHQQAQRAPTAPVSHEPSATRWWTPGNGKPLAELATYRNASGSVGVLNAGGALATAGHPFFEPIGQNGRACVTCHQPASGMSLSVDLIRRRWEETGGKDPLFAPVDGMNCPHLPPEDPKSHSLLLERGLFRIFLPWPPKAPDGRPIEPEFTLEVVRDPTGCNTHPVYGLHSEHPMVSVYRRPRPVANLRYVTHQGFGVFAFIGKNGLPASRDPDTGLPSAMNLLADARQPTLKTQAIEAAVTHLQFDGRLDDERLRRITEFERQLYVAQSRDAVAGDLMEEGGPPGLGPRNLAAGREGLLGNNITHWVIPLGGKWKQLPQGDDPATNARNRKRESIARGHDVFMFRTFWIRDAMHLNTVGLGNPAKRTCSTCHGMHMLGMDVANGWMDIGTTNLPWAREEPRNPWNPRQPELPLFKVTCKDSVPPHPFLGRVIYTQDPGRALISGKCNDVGTVVMQQLRGLAARAPYFSNGSAASLAEMVDFYDRRFNIGFTDQEREDLINFLGAL